MKTLPSLAVVAVFLGFAWMAAPPLLAEENAGPEPVRTEETEKALPTKFEKLSTTKGVEYFDCQVIRADPDALIVRHREGVARISFFHVSREIREAYHFDPFAAMEHYEQEEERQRNIRWMTFWDKERHEAKLAEEATQKKLVETAVAEWVPVEATVVQTFEGGFLASCKKVTFVKTTKRSKLGFLVDGPSKRKLVEFAGGQRIILRLAAGTLPAAHSTWQGYVRPYPEEEGRSYSYQGARLSASSYPAVGRK